MDEKEQLIAAYKGVTGRYPRNLIEVLNVLINPAVVSAAKAYIQVNDKSTACQKFMAPWNCVKEAEAYAQTVSDAWTGSMSEVMENWCVNCQARLYGEDPGDAVPMDSHWLEDDGATIENPWLIGGEDPDPCMRDVDGCGD